MELNREVTKGHYKDREEDIFIRKLQSRARDVSERRREEGAK